MSFTPRQYQIDAINAGLNFFKSKRKFNGLLVVPTGAGKSIIIANIAKELEGNTLVFQPSKEILEQNYAKFTSYGFRAGIYSASAGSKFIQKITFVTIGSVAKKPHLFKDVQHIIVDEAHLTNAQGGMYDSFFKSLPNAKILGLTATPYRLSSSQEGAMLKFLTRTRTKIFTDVLYIIQNEVLFNAGYLSKLEYFSFDVINRSMIQMNSNGTDFNEVSLQNYYKSIDMPSKTIGYAKSLLAQRKNLLIFCSLISEAEQVRKGIPGSVVITGETESKKRAKILADFKSGVIKCVINVGVLAVGFDFPELEALLLARSTMSLALYYQIVGRVMRIHPDKISAWVVDLGGNINFFGKIETMQILKNEKGLYYVSNNGRPLTNVVLTKN